MAVCFCGRPWKISQHVLCGGDLSWRDGIPADHGFIILQRLISDIVVNVGVIFELQFYVAPTIRKHHGYLRPKAGLIPNIVFPPRREPFREDGKKNKP